MQDYSARGADQAAYLEALYERFSSDPNAVDPAWRAYFADLLASAPAVAVDGLLAKQGAVSRLIQVYCNRGHLVADIDPLGLLQRPEPEVLRPAHFGLTASDLEQEFYTDPPFGAAPLPKRMKLRDIIAVLKRVYCGTIGAEFAHVSTAEERLWLHARFQSGRLGQVFSAAERRTFLWQLTAAEGLER